MSLLPGLEGSSRSVRTAGWPAVPLTSTAAPVSIRRRDGVLLIHCFAGCSVRSILGVLGLDWTALYETASYPVLEPKSPASKPDGRRKEHLDRLWEAACPLDGADPASRYLRTRGLLLERPSPALRYLEALEYRDEGRVVGVYPALLARIVHPLWGLVALHRTYLEPGGSGKAPVSSPKKLTRPLFAGATKGAAIRLSSVGSRLAVAEGLETALAVGEMTA